MLFSPLPFLSMLAFKEMEALYWDFCPPVWYQKNNNGNDKKSKFGDGNTFCTEQVFTPPNMLQSVMLTLAWRSCHDDDDL